VRDLPERILPPESGFPIPVRGRNFVGTVPITAACDMCGRAFLVDDADEESYLVSEGLLDCSADGCDGHVSFAYLDAPECENCGKLSFDLIRDEKGRYHCDRRCSLQAEYARSLESRGSE
jgi:hypothetical protein